MQRDQIATTLQPHHMLKCIYRVEHFIQPCICWWNGSFFKTGFAAKVFDICSTGRHNCLKKVFIFNKDQKFKEPWGIGIDYPYTLIATLFLEQPVYWKIVLYGSCSFKLYALAKIVLKNKYGAPPCICTVLVRNSVAQLGI